MQVDHEVGITMSFLTLAGAQLMHVFNLRGPRAGLIRNDVTRNPYVWGAIGLCILLLAAAVYVPQLAGVLKTQPLTSAQWLAVAALSLAPLPAEIVARWVRLAVRART
jgi:Ca2+-transporting ATPase